MSQDYDFSDTDTDTRAIRRSALSIACLVLAAVIAAGAVAYHFFN